MANKAHSTKHQETSSPWFRQALVKTLVGTLLGLVTAALLVMFSHSLFPEVADFDYDIGLRMRRFSVEHLSFDSLGMTPNKDLPDAYLFLDVDPEQGTSSSANESSDIASRESSACASLSDEMHDRYTLVPSAVNQCSEGPCSNKPRFLNCNSARPLNRYLLAELVKEVRNRGARLIILDILLAAEPGVVAPEENSALRDALWSSKEGAAQVIYARPAQFGGQSETSGINHVIIEPTHTFDASMSSAGEPRTVSSMGPLVAAAVALPAPGQPLRRYPKCYQSDIYGEDLIPSLPYLASAILMHHEAAFSTLCRPSGATRGHPAEGNDSPPRIHYTLPSIRADQDNTLANDDFRLWSVYRRIYNRCMASNFWSTKSQCSEQETYKDKVVVIGATNPRRQDRHYTPFGDMAGAEVVINTIRSFIIYPLEHEETLEQAVLSEVGTVLRCMIIWFGFYCLLGFIHRSTHKGTPLVARFALGAVVFVGFWITLIAVLGVTFRATYASFSILVGVLSIGVEQYVEVMKTWILRPFEQMLERLLRLPSNTSEH
jgi:hypothetical protein